MQRFNSETIREIYETRFAAGVPEHVSIKAHVITHALIACCDLRDSEVLGQVSPQEDVPDRYGLHVDGKWHVTFAWHTGVGAHGIEIERL